MRAPNPARRLRTRKLPVVLNKTRMVLASPSPRGKAGAGRSLASARVLDSGIDTPAWAADKVDEVRAVVGLAASRYGLSRG
ncbi:hypothetical protein ACDY96_12360 [Rhizobium mongolense]